MEKCPICKINDADKKNVHLIPWFLIKTCVTDKGSGYRDHEISFTIDPADFTKLYAGRSILPEKIEEFGELTELQKEAANPYSRDYLICHDCEDKLSRLEAIFANQFSDKKIQSACTNTLAKVSDHSVIIDRKYNRSLFELLIQSIYYRCSIGRFNDFELPQDVQEKIEENLRSVFSSVKFKKVKPADEINLQHQFPIITTLLFSEKGIDPTSHYIVINNSKLPYFIVAGKWMFQLFIEERHLKTNTGWLFGLNSTLDSSKAYKIVKNDAHVIALEERVGNRIVRNITEYFVEKKIAGLKKSIRDLYKYKNKCHPKKFLIDYILSRYFVHLKEQKTEVESFMEAFNDLNLLP